MVLQSCYALKKLWLCTNHRLIFYYKGAYAAPLYPRRRVRPGAMRRWCESVSGWERQAVFSAKCSFRPPAFLRNDETNLSPD